MIFDLVIVGTGPSAFSVLESYVTANTSSKVLILEAGKGVVNAQDPLVYSSQNRDFRLSPTMNIGFGGTSNLWHNVIAPLDRIDFEKREWIPNSGWPISFEELGPNYAEACKWFGISFPVFQSDVFKDIYEQQLKKIQFNTKMIDLKMFVQNKHVFRSSIGIRKICNQFPNVILEQGAVALNFEQVENGVALRMFEKKTKKIKHIKAKNFVLSAGALNSPVILLNSGFISKQLPVLGRYLMDHPMGGISQYQYQKPLHLPILSRHSDGEHVFKVAFALKEDMQRRHRTPNSVLYLRPSFKLGYNNASAELKRDLMTLKAKIYSLQSPFAEIRSTLGNLDVLKQVLQYKFGILNTHSLTEGFLVTEQVPSSESKIELSESCNPFGVAYPKVSWNLSTHDLENAVKHCEIVMSSLMKSDIVKETVSPSVEHWSETLSSAAHHLGTVRMAVSSQQGCVDKNLKVFGQQNIYVCDGSVFPTSGNANPTLTCMALGHRLGKYLK